MAATTKKRKKLIEKVEEVIAQPIIEEVIAQLIEEVKPEPIECLLPEHHKNLEIYQRDIEIAKMTMAVEEQFLQNTILNHQLLELKIEKQKRVVSERASHYEAKKTKYENYKQKVIWPFYGVNEAEGLGYDPISGKIKK